MSSRQLKLRFQEINGLRHDRLQNKFTGADVADKVLEAKQMEIFGTANDDIAVRVLLVQLVNLHDRSSILFPFAATSFDKPF